MNPRDTIMAAALAAFDEHGCDRVAIAAIRKAAGVSNGSFFHWFGSKDGLAAALYLDCVVDYHRAMAGAVAGGPGAEEGIERLIRAHLDWVVSARPRARFLFEQVRAEWLTLIRAEREAENARFAATIEDWRRPHVAAGRLRELPPMVFFALLAGPAQMLCRAFLAGTSAEDPRLAAADLIGGARRALLA